MHLWLVVYAFLTTSPQSILPGELATFEPEPMRYRGIEQLLEKFEAQAEAAANPY